MLGRCFPALTLVAWLALAVRADLPASSALKLLIALLLTQVLPGVLIWRAVRPVRGSWFEDLAMGFAIGSVIAIGIAAAVASVRFQCILSSSERGAVSPVAGTVQATGLGTVRQGLPRLSG